MNVRDILESIFNAAKRMEFLPTGFSKLDKHLDGGLLKKELIVVGAFTGVGKSYFAGQVLMNVAFSGVKSMYFSTEISNETVVARMIGSLSNIKSTRVMAGRLTDEEKKNSEDARAKLLASGDFLQFYDDVYDLDDIVKLIQEQKPEFVVIDFIQNVFVNRMSDEYSRLSYITLQLQKLAKQSDCCVLILSQLSNQAAKKTTHEVLEFKGSGNIATVSDLGFVMTRNNHDTFDLKLQKNRRGASAKAIRFNFRQPGGWIYESEWVI